MESRIPGKLMRHWEGDEHADFLLKRLLLSVLRWVLFLFLRGRSVLYSKHIKN